jgi:hypothetical protein
MTQGITVYLGSESEFWAVLHSCCFINISGGVWVQQAPLQLGMLKQADGGE